MTDCVPEVRDVKPQKPHALVLRPVRLLVPDQPLAVDPLGQDVDADGRQRDASVPEGAEEPANDVGRGAGDHGQKLRLTSNHLALSVESYSKVIN